MTTWYLARGAGFAALVLLTAATCLGALMTGRGRPHARVAAQAAHRLVAALGLAALMLHVGTILIDADAHVGWRGALVPFTAGYRPDWVALGTLAAYTVVLIAVVGVARGRIAGSVVGAAAWRCVHALAYVAWTLALLHGLNAGTDTRTPWARSIYLVCALAVGGSVVVRAALARRPSLVRVRAGALR